MSLLEVKNLQVQFQTERGIARAVRGASFAMEEGKTLALVGESGSGKSVTAMSILRLLDGNGGIESGEIRFTENGETKRLDKLSLKEMQAVRGNKISMIFQEPMTALNPVLRIKKQLCEPFLIHRNLAKKEAVAEALRMLESVHIPNPKRVLNGYPHQLSGGMRQRVMIAMALACQPKILIADEPTTALDVTVQAQILRLIASLQEQNGTAVLFITHDLGVVSEIADEVAVMYFGEIVDRAKTSGIFRGKYLHPYTEGLLRSIPAFGRKRKTLESIHGNVPSPYTEILGCAFSSRCPYATMRWIREKPQLAEVGKGRFVRCFYPSKEERKNARENAIVR